MSLSTLIFEFDYPVLHACVLQWNMVQVWGKTGSKIYGPTSGEDYDDNQFRFMLLAKVNISSAYVQRFLVDWSSNIQLNVALKKSLILALEIPIQAAIEACKVLHLDSNEFFSGPFGKSSTLGKSFLTGDSLQLQGSKAKHPFDLSFIGCSI